MSRIRTPCFAIHSTYSAFSFFPTLCKFPLFIFHLFISNFYFFKELFFANLSIISTVPKLSDYEPVFVHQLENQNAFISSASTSIFEFPFSNLISLVDFEKKIFNSINNYSDKLLLKGLFCFIYLFLRF